MSAAPISTRVRLAIAAAAAALALVAPPAAAAQSVSTILFGGTGTVISQTSVPARMSGALSVSFAGSPAAGCAGLGVCRYSGSVSWVPPGGGSLAILRTLIGHHLSDEVLLSLNANASQELGFGGQTTAGVQAAAVPGSGLPGSGCADASFSGAFLTLPLHRGRVALSLRETLPAILSTRCAGPRGDTILPLLPAPTLSLARIEHGGATVPLTASGSFSADGFAGTFDSTLVLDLGRPGKTTKPNNGSQAGTLRQVLTARYRTNVTGTITERVSGDPDTARCDPLGACGASGTITLTPRVAAAAGQFEIYGSRKTPLSTLRTALGLAPGATPRGITVDGDLSWRGGGTSSVSLTQDGSTCTGSQGLSGGGLLLLAHNGAIQVLLDPVGAVQTGCPGPFPQGSQPLSVGQLPLRLLAHRTFTVSSLKTTTLQDDGYTVQVVPHLKLTFTRVSVRASMQRLF